MWISNLRKFMLDWFLKQVKVQIIIIIIFILKASLVVRCRFFCCKYANCLYIWTFIFFSFLAIVEMPLKKTKKTSPSTNWWVQLMRLHSNYLLLLNNFWATNEIMYLWWIHATQSCQLFIWPGLHTLTVI